MHFVDFLKRKCVYSNVSILFACLFAENSFTKKGVFIRVAHNCCVSLLLIYMVKWLLRTAKQTRKSMLNNHTINNDDNCILPLVDRLVSCHQPIYQSLSFSFIYFISSLFFIIIL